MELVRSDIVQYFAHCWVVAEYCLELVMKFVVAQRYVTLSVDYMVVFHDDFASYNQVLELVDDKQAVLFLFVRYYQELHCAMF